MSGGAYEINDLKADVELKAYTADLGTAAFLDTGSGSTNVLTKSIADGIYQPIGGAVTFPFFRPEDYGAVADGSTNDRTALIDCLTAAAGRKIYLTSGKRYRISGTLTYTGSVDIETLGTDPAEIYSPTNSIGNLFNITNNGSTTFDSSANWKSTKSLISSMTIGLNGWVLDNVTDIVVGDLLQVVSSQLYYGDNRGIVKKSELHKVHRISGNTVFTEAAAFESYSVPTETVTVGVISPINVRLKNVGFKSTPNASTAGMARGLRVWCADNLNISDCYVDGFSILGLWMHSCYSPTVSGGYFANANDSSSTGYGIQTYGCTFTTITNAKFWNNRRGIDISGSPYISRVTLVSGCFVLGNTSQLSTQGQAWWPPIAGATVQDSFGFGCHSGSDGIVWENCKLYNVAYPFVKRGRNVSIINCEVYGDCRAIVGNSYSAGLFIDGIIYNDGYSNLANGNVYIAGLNKDDRYPTALVVFNQFHDSPDNELIEIKNCRVTVRRGLIWTTILTNQPNNVILKNNHVIVRPEVGFTSPIGYLGHTETATGSNSGPRSGWKVSDNTFKRPSGVTNTIKDFVNITLSSDYEAALTKTYRLTIADNAKEVIDLPFAASRARIALDCAGSASGCFQVASGTTESREWGTLTNIGIVSSIFNPMGADGLVNVGLSNNQLHVENRLGSTKTINVTVLHGI
jgi:hypothetical protein